MGSAVAGMADAAQSGQRNIYKSTQYKPNNKSNYHEEYIQSLSFNAADVPVQAQRSGKVTVAASRTANIGRRDNYGHRMDCGERVHRIYDSLYPGDLQKTFGETQSFKANLSNQAPRLRPPPPNPGMKIPSKFIPDPSATMEQTLTAAFGDTTRSFGPHIMPLQCSPNHFTVPKPMTGECLMGTTQYIPRRGTSEAEHLPSSPGTRRNLTPAKSQAEEVANGLIRSKQYKQAVQCLTQAISGDPRNPVLYRNRAASLWQLARFEEAQRDTNKVCELMPNNRKAMLRHKAVCDYLENYHQCTPGSDRGNITVGQLLMPEEFSAHNYTQRLTTQWNTRPVPIPTRVDAHPPSFYEKGSPTSEPLVWAQQRGSRGFWDTQLTSPEGRFKFVHGGKRGGNIGSNWNSNPSPTTVKFPNH